LRLADALAVFCSAFGTTSIIVIYLGILESWRKIALFHRVSLSFKAALAGWSWHNLAQPWTRYTELPYETYISQIAAGGIDEQTACQNREQVALVDVVGLDFRIAPTHDR